MACTLGQPQAAHSAWHFAQFAQLEGLQFCAYHREDASERAPNRARAGLSQVRQEPIARRRVLSALRAGVRAVEG